MADRVCLRVTDAQPRISDFYTRPVLTVPCCSREHPAYPVLTGAATELIYPLLMRTGLEIDQFVFVGRPPSRPHNAPAGLSPFVTHECSLLSNATSGSGARSNLRPDRPLSR